MPTSNLKAEFYVENTYKTALEHFYKVFSSQEDHNADNKIEAKNEKEDKSYFNHIILLTRLASLTAESDSAKNEILSKNTVKSLGLLSGSDEKPQEHLLNKLEKTTTIFGNVMMANMLINPTTDVDTLKNRQKIIKYFIESPGLVEELEKNLQEIAKNEEILFNYLNAEKYTERNFLENTLVYFLQSSFMYEFLSSLLRS